jgi:hypothetical protein
MCPPIPPLTDPVDADLHAIVAAMQSDDPAKLSPALLALKSE